MEFLENVSLQSLNGLRLDSRAAWFCEVTTLDDLQEAILFAREQGLSVLTLGGGTNLVPLADISALVISNRLSGRQETSPGVFRVAAGENWHETVASCVHAGWYGVENLALIPGTVGAAPIQNIGAYGVELSDVLVSLNAVHLLSGEERQFEKDECLFGYRDSVFKIERDWFVTSVTVACTREDKPVTGYPGINEYLEKNELAINCRSVFDAVIQVRQAKLPDPAVNPNVGSFFKNPVVNHQVGAALQARYPDCPVFEVAGGCKLSAAWLIDQAGLKGVRRGRAMVSARHALVITTEAGAGADDVTALVTLVRDTVRDTYGVELEVEPTLYP